MAEPFDPSGLADKIAAGTVTTLDLRPQINKMLEAYAAATTEEEWGELQEQIVLALKYFVQAADREAGPQR